MSEGRYRQRTHTKYISKASDLARLEKSIKTIVDQLTKIIQDHYSQIRLDVFRFNGFLLQIKGSWHFTKVKMPKADITNCYTLETDVEEIQLGSIEPKAI